VQRAANVWDRFYRRHEAPWRGERAVVDLVPRLGPGPVLELGCGNGKLLKPLAAAGVSVVGLDISWHILTRLPAGIPAVLGDASALPFRDESFTAVLDVHCTGHLRSRGRQVAAEEALRVLKPGGLLVIERMTPNDLRASQGKPVEGEAGMRVVEDGRETHFAHGLELVEYYESLGLQRTHGELHRRMPGHGGRQVVRESVRLEFVKVGGEA
jgi:SAM-dependent methyltransferase